jgi:quercetin dioxygenase-like cupin family protein
MKAHDIRAALTGISDLDFRTLSSFDQGTVGVFRASSGVSPWERHPTGDELLHVLEGEVEIVVQAEVGPVRTKVSAGSVFVVPRGLWHRHDVRERLVELYVTRGATEHSNADDPRKAKRRQQRAEPPAVAAGHAGRAKVRARGRTQRGRRGAGALDVS